MILNWTKKLSLVGALALTTALANAATWVGTFDVDPQGLANAPAGPFTWSVECPDQDPADPPGNTSGSCYQKTGSRGHKKMVIECTRNGRKKSDEKDCRGNCPAIECKSGEARAWCDCTFTTNQPGVTIPLNVDCGLDYIQYSCASGSTLAAPFYHLNVSCFNGATGVAAGSATTNAVITGSSCVKRRAL